MEVSPEIIKSNTTAGRQLLHSIGREFPSIHSSLEIDVVFSIACSWLGKKIDRKQIKRRKREIFLLVLLGYSVQHFNSTTTRFVVNSFLVLVRVIFAAALRARLSLADYSRRRSRPTRRKIFAAKA